MTTPSDDSKLPAVAEPIRDDPMYLELTDRQKAWLECYLANSFQGTEAAMQAGLVSRDNHPRARRVAHLIHSNLKVQTLIRKALHTLGVNRDKCLYALKQMIFDMDAMTFLRYAEGETSLDELAKSGLPLHLVNEITVTSRVNKDGSERTTRKIKTPDKLKAVQMLLDELNNRPIVGIGAELELPPEIETDKDLVRYLLKEMPKQIAFPRSRPMFVESHALESEADDADQQRTGATDA